MNAVNVTLMLLGAAVLLAVLVPMILAWWRARGTRLIVCPETQAPAAVEVDAVDAAFGALLGSVEPELRACTRWPERQECDQACLSQIEAAAGSHGYRVRTLLSDWYQGQTCALCGKPFEPIHAWDHKPALMRPDRVTFEWAQVPAENLPKLLEAWLPVCWDCHIVESLYRNHPDLVIERPDRVRTPVG